MKLYRRLWGEGYNNDKRGFIIIRKEIRWQFWRQLTCYRDCKVCNSHLDCILQDCWLVIYLLISKAYHWMSCYFQWPTYPRYNFICEEWLTPEESLDRIVQPTNPADLKSLRSMFFTNTKKKVTEDHIWLSVFIRPERSRFRWVLLYYHQCKRVSSLHKKNL